MSRGLGELQRAILSTLDVAKCVFPPDYDSPDVLWYHGRPLRLPADVYDLRASLQYLGRATGQVTCNLSLRKGTIVRSNYASSFCRAVRGLVAGGYLAQWSTPIYRNSPARS